MLKLTILAMMTMCIFATTLFAEAPPVPSEAESEALMTSVRSNMDTIAKITDEFPSLIAKKTPPEQLDAKLSQAEGLLSKVEQTCETLGDPTILEYYGKYVAAAYAQNCRRYRTAALPWIATMTVKTANSYASKGNKTVAKRMYRDVIIRFTGDAYRSQVREAEFGLDDLKSTK